MYPTLFHIYGPIKLHSFSAMLGIGILLFIHLATKAVTKRNLMDGDQFQEACLQASLIGVLGARLLHIISESHEYTSVMKMISIWNGGLSIFGGIIAIACYAFWYVKKYQLDGLAILDIVCIYAPLVHAVARIGCFLAGCCYGQPTNAFWSVMYTNSECAAPLYTHLHPTQLYSAGIFFALFALLYTLEKHTVLKPGQYAMVYLFLSSIERLSIDFLRGDRIMDHTHFFSFHQFIAFALCTFAIIGFYVLRNKNYTLRAHS